jgi:hypothetical protein
MENGYIITGHTFFDLERTYVQLGCDGVFQELCVYVQREMEFSYHLVLSFPKKKKKKKPYKLIISFF